MTVVGQTRVLPQELPVTADKLRPIFRRAGAFVGVASAFSPLNSVASAFPPPPRLRRDRRSFSRRAGRRTHRSCSEGGQAEVSLNCMDLDLTPDQQDFQRRVAEFASTRGGAGCGDRRRRTLPARPRREAAAGGLMGLTLAPEWGGGGRDHVSYALAIEALARASAVVAVIAGVNTSLVAEPLARFGSDAQKQTWLRRLARANRSARSRCPRSSRDPTRRISRRVARLDDRGYVLNGRKVWVANAEAADVAIVFAATQPGSRAAAYGAFWCRWIRPGIGGAASGFARRPRPRLHGSRLTDVRVGADALLGGPARVSGGDVGARRRPRRDRRAGARRRPGGARRGARLREAPQAFGQPIGNYQAIQWMLADIATELDAARMLMLKAADARSGRRRATLEAAMAKLAASEAAHRAADRAMQILASHGYRRGSLVERLFRDVRATEIYQGTSEVQRMVIAGRRGPPGELRRRRFRRLVHVTPAAVADRPCDARRRPQIASSRRVTRRAAPVSRVRRGCSSRRSPTMSFAFERNTVIACCPDRAARECLGPELGLRCQTPLFAARVVEERGICARAAAENRGSRRPPK